MLLSYSAETELIWLPELAIVPWSIRLMIFSSCMLVAVHEENEE